MKWRLQERIFRLFRARESDLRIWWLCDAFDLFRCSFEILLDLAEDRFAVVYSRRDVGQCIGVEDGAIGAIGFRLRFYEISQLVPINRLI